MSTVYCSAVLCCTVLLTSLKIASPVFERCDPCTLHYDAVVKMETFDSDVR